MRRHSSLALVGIACVLVGLAGCSDRRERQGALTTSSTQAGATLSGRVVNFQNKTRGVGGALVRGRNEPVSVFSARTAADGRFQVTVPDGTHVVTAQGGGCRNMNRGANISFSTDVRVVVENGQVVAGAQPAGDGAAQLPTLYMDCRTLPVVTIFPFGPNSVAFTAMRDGPVDEPLTVYFDVAAAPGLFQCVVNGDSFTFPRGFRTLAVLPVIPRGAINFATITMALRPTDDYVVGSPASAARIVGCGS